MYSYIYDSFVNTPKYKKELERIEVKLAHVGVEGKIRRLNILHHQKHEIEESIRRGATTVILVGNDRTLAQSVDVFARYDLVIGIIPLGPEKDNLIARTLGIPPGELACEMISRRNVAQLDLGMVNGRYFLTTASLDVPKFTCQGGKQKQFSIRPTVSRTRLTVENLSFPTVEHGVVIKGNPRDGLVEVVMRPEPDGITRLLSLGNPTSLMPSVFPVDELRIPEPDGAIMTLDGCRTVKLPALIKVAPQKFKMIIGRERTFA